MSNDGLFARQVDFAVKTAPSGYRYAANRTGFVWFGGTSLTAPWIRVYRASDLNRDPVTALAYDSADDKRVVVAQANLVDQALLRLLPDATQTGDDMAPFAHNAWTTLTYPDAGKAPVAALLVDGMTMFAGVVKSQSPVAGAYLYTSTNGGTTWAAVVADVRRRRARARLRPVEARDPLRRRRRLQERPAPRRQRRRLVEVHRRRRALLAHLDVVARARRRSAAHHRRRSRRRPAPVGLLRSPQQHRRAPTATSSRASTAAPPGRRSRRRTASSPSPTRPPKGCSRTPPAAPT